MSGQVVQAKLRIGPQDDPLEREADRAAEAAVSRQAVPMLRPASPMAQRRCAEGEEDGRPDAVRAKAAPGGRQHQAGTETAAAAALVAGGAPLPADLRAYFEPRFGADFSRVRAHTDAGAARAADALTARAFTVGTDIAFAAGAFAPATAEGRRLLAHELVHTIQQQASTPMVPGQGVTGRAGGVQVQRQVGLAGKIIGGIQDQLRRVVRAADRARKNPDNRTEMLINGAEIVYRLIRAYSPDYADLVSGVGYDRSVKGIRVDVSASGKSISITVGRSFILDTTGETVTDQARRLRSAIAAKAPRKAAKPSEAPAASTAKEPPSGPQLDAQDDAAIQGLKRIFCPTQRTGHEFCGHVIRAADGSFRITDDQTQGLENFCEAQATFRGNESAVAYYHSHPEGRGLDFTEQATLEGSVPGQMAGRAAPGDIDEAERRHIDYYLINSKGEMKRYTPSTEIGGRGSRKRLGIAETTCS